MTPRSHHTSVAPFLLMAALVVLAVQPATIDAQTPATGQAAPPTASASGGDQPQAVATSGSTFWTSFGYLLITLLVAGSLYAICRSSQRT
jgi:predicted membrane channel-forming protein YqfA (hemolysin III family)